MYRKPKIKSRIKKVMFWASNYKWDMYFIKKFKIII